MLSLCQSVSGTKLYHFHSQKTRKTVQRAGTCLKKTRFTVTASVRHVSDLQMNTKIRKKIYENADSAIQKSSQQNKIQMKRIPGTHGYRRIVYHR